MAPIISLITSDVSEESVLVQAYEEDLTLIFRFSHDVSRPSCLCSRIVTSFNEADGATEVFPDRQAMRNAIYDAVGSVWISCAAHPSVRMPDVIVQLREMGDQLVWSICHESKYQHFLQTLRPVSLVEASETLPRYVSLAQLRSSYSLRGRRSATPVKFNDRLYVYQGLSFRSFLELGEEEFRQEVSSFHHELDVLSKLPKLPYLPGNPDFLVTTTPLDKHDPVYVCGTLYPHLDGDLQARIDEAAGSHRIPIFDKLRWAFQITSALRAAHRVSQYHMDLKPANVLLDRGDAVLADWEQYGANPCFIAPEADGSWDLDNNNNDTILGRLRYRKYEGPERKNSAVWPFWNVFRLWQNQCPEALEAAEVYALGRTLWVLFQQVASEDLSPGTVTAWTDRADDIPLSWKDVVARCTDPEPADRPTLNEVWAFWNDWID